MALFNNNRTKNLLFGIHATGKICNSKRSMKCLTVERFTPKIRAICDFERPLLTRFCTFRAFFDSFNFCDSAVSGRPSFLPLALMLASEDFVRSDMRLRSISAASPNDIA